MIRGEATLVPIGRGEAKRSVEANQAVIRGEAKRLLETNPARSSGSQGLKRKSGKDGAEGAGGKGKEKNRSRSQSQQSNRT